MTASRLPYAPLERILRSRYDSADLSADTAARMLGVTSRQIQRWKKDGLTARQADRAAIAADLHPLLVWGQAWTCAEIAAGIDRWLSRQDGALGATA